MRCAIIQSASSHSREPGPDWACLPVWEAGAGPKSAALLVGAAAWPEGATEETADPEGMRTSGNVFKQVRKHKPKTRAYTSKTAHLKHTSKSKSHVFILLNPPDLPSLCEPTDSYWSKYQQLFCISYKTNRDSKCLGKNVQIFFHFHQIYWLIV